MVRGNGRSLAWRVFDAQYWGVPQRRRRIYLVADFRGQRAPEILFEPQSLSGNTSEGREAREEVAAATGNGVEGAKCYCLQGSMVGRADHNGPQGDDINENVCFTLNTIDRHAVCFKAKGAGKINCEPGGVAGAVSSKWAKGTGGPAGDEHYNLVCHPQVTGTLCSSGAGMSRPARMANETDLVVAFCPGGQHDVAHAIRAQASRADKPDSTTYVCYRYQDERIGIVEDKITATMRSESATTDERSVPAYVIQQYAVRRLTPIECERLQGIPDNWTAGGSDTARYKAIGNSLAKPCALFVINQIAEVLRRDNL